MTGSEQRPGSRCSSRRAGAMHVTRPELNRFKISSGRLGDEGAEGETRSAETPDILKVVPPELSDIRAVPV